MKIAVTSENKLKIQAVKKAYASFGIPVEVSGYKTNSSVGEQPVEEQTVLGAEGRITDLKLQNIDFDIVISIESGIFREHEQWIDKAVVILEDKKTEEKYLQYSEGIVFPDMYVDKARSAGFLTTTVGQVMAEEGYVDQAKDPHLSITGVSRQVYIENVVKKLVQNTI